MLIFIHWWSDCVNCLWSVANWVFDFNQSEVNTRIRRLLCKKTHYSCHLFKSDDSESYSKHCFYIDHSIRTTSNDSRKNMNEQNKSSHRYANWLSSIFEFQFSLNCFFLEWKNNIKTEELNFYSYIKEIFHFCYISI